MQTMKEEPCYIVVSTTLDHARRYPEGTLVRSTEGAEALKSAGVLLLPFDDSEKGCTPESATTYGRIAYGHGRELQDGVPQRVCPFPVFFKSESTLFWMAAIEGEHPRLEIASAVNEGGASTAVRNAEILNGETGLKYVTGIAKVTGREFAEWSTLCLRGAAMKGSPCKVLWLAWTVFP